MSPADVFAHESALVASDQIGDGTKIWAFCNVQAGAVLGRACVIGDHCFIEGGARLGDNVTVKTGVSIWEGVTVEDDCFIGPNAVFTNDLFPRSPRSAAAGARYESKAWLSPTLVRTGATIGANATILAGIEIGAWAVVGAGATVVRSVGCHEIVAGSPARRLGFACRCGQPMDAVDDAFRCRSCPRRYARDRETGAVGLLAEEG